MPPEFSLNEDASASSESVGRETTSPPRWIGAVFRPLRLAKIAILVGILALLPYVIPHLPNLASRPEYRLPTRQIRIVPEPELPVPTNLLDQVRERSKLPLEISLLDEKPLRDLASAFAEHPWIAKVISVRKSYPVAVTVEVEYRHPVGMVEVPGGRLPVDSSGFILPPHDFMPSDLKRYPTIRGLNAPGAIRPGMVWKNPSLMAATRLAELLAPKWSEFHLESIVVPDQADSTTTVSKVILELRTNSGSKIIWGRTPGTDYPGELTPNQKLGRLEKYLAEFGGFDKPNGPYEIDIRHWQEISRRQLSSGQATSRGNGRSRR